MYILAKSSLSFLKIIRKHSAELTIESACDSASALPPIYPALMTKSLKKNGQDNPARHCNYAFLCTYLLSVITTS